MKIADEYVQKMRARWLPGAMYPSEIAWLCAQVIAHDIQVLVECGRQDGVSTRCLGELLGPHGVRILSIDFDADQANLRKVKASLEGLDVECVSGDIHFHVPRLLNEHKGKKIAVVQDGPKGWEGLSTLVPAAFNEDVALLAQHNLHRGQKSRAYFGLIACNAPFLEHDVKAEQPRRIRMEEMDDASFSISNREIDHSSLGICSLTGMLRAAVLENVRQLDSWMGPWSALKTAEAWRAGNLQHVSNLRRRQRFSWYRFKNR